MKRGIAETLALGSGGGPGFRWKRWLIVVLVLAIAAAGAWYFLKPDPKATLTNYKTEPVKRGDLTVIVTATGTLKPTNSVDVGSELSGIVKSVEADYNSRVKVGQVLARLDTSKLEATITQSRAALESAQAKVLQTRATITETKAEARPAQKTPARSAPAGSPPSPRWMRRRQPMPAPRPMPPVPPQRSPRPRPSSRRTKRTLPKR